MELLRIHKYITDVLFNNEQDDFFGELTYYYHPDLNTIKENGIEYYYPNISKHNFSEYFNYFELLHSAAILDDMCNQDNKLFNINNNYNDQEIIGIINNIIQKVFHDINDKEDYYITMFGFKKRER